MKINADEQKDRIRKSIVLARKEKPAYAELYPLLEMLFLVQLEALGSLQLVPPELTTGLVQTKWEEGFPILRRWDFPVDPSASENILKRMEGHIPQQNLPLKTAHAALLTALETHAEQKQAIWQSFLQHEFEPWEEWVDTRQVDTSSLLFWARSGLRPGIERVAQDLLRRYPPPQNWFKGYCPICGSLPALLFLQGEGERLAYCSWCATQWSLHRLQCPCCDNRFHESLGYIYIESEPHYRIHYCRICKMYFKSIDFRERLDPPYLPLEEWTSLHLDLVAQRAGWKQPASPSPVVYGQRDA